MPLSIHKLPKAAIQPLVDKLGDRLPTWKSGLLNRSGRVALTKSTLSAIPVYLSIALGLPAWAIKAMEKLMKAFVWQETTAVTGGQCVVAWKKVCRPTSMGGLGIPDLKLQGYALRLRWEWLRRTDATRTWVDLPANSEPIIASFFAASTTSVVGDGNNTLF